MIKNFCRRWIYSGWLLMVGVLPVADAQEPIVKIQLVQIGESAKLVVEGLSDTQLSFATDRLAESGKQANQFFSVFIGSDTNQATPLFGKCTIESSKLIFEPRYPLKPDLDYIAVLNFGSDSLIVKLNRSVDTTIHPPTRVLAIYPSGDRLPQNLLRVYIHFSQPMNRGDSYSHIELLDASGEQVESPFFELPQELWDPQQVRFSLLFDPGRIKQGLAPHRELGPPLLPGETYTLVVNRNWRDARGRPLAETLRKPFQVIEPLESQLDLEKWEFTFPNRAATRSPLRLKFDRPMNHAMLFESIEVQSTDDNVPGTIKVSDEESVWEFIPDQPWQMAKYRVVFDAGIEDLAGNRLSRPFEVDLTKPRLNQGPLNNSIEFRVLK